MPDRSGLIDALLTKTWPARMVRGAISGMMLPGDVYAGRVDPNSNEAIGRAADLASMVAGGRVPKVVSSPVFSPETMYHGTASAFDHLSPWQTGKGSGASLEMGTWLTPDAADASHWAMAARGDAGPNVMPVHVAPGAQKVIEASRYNPALFAKEAWKARLGGYDTVLFKGVDEGRGPIDQLLVLNPRTNIRSKFAPPVQTKPAEPPLKLRGVLGAGGVLLNAEGQEVY